MISNLAKRVIIVAVLLSSAIAITAGIEQDTVTREFGEITVDFGNRNVTWTTINFDECPTAIDSLDYICKDNGYSFSIDGNGSIVEIDSIYSVPGDATWNLWVVKCGTTEWVKMSAPYSVSLTDCTISSWAYCDSNGEPTVAVDQSGRSIYGHGKVQRVVSLSPSITEIISNIKAADLLVGVDRHSDYPIEIMKMRNEEKLAVVGDYGTVLFEEILGAKPDIVLCDGLQYNHVQIANRLRSSGIESVVLCTEETFDDIIDNIYIVGTVLGRGSDANIKISQIENETLRIISLIEEAETSDNGTVMVVLGLNSSPFVAGSHTYVGDIIARLLGENAFANLDGWLSVDREVVVKNNPSKIIVLTTVYKATQLEYNCMLSILPDDWKSTDAYRNGEIYMMCEDAGDMMQRPSPRVTQLMGLLGRILHPEVFHLSVVPKYIGNDYENLLV
ncbi:MAG: ABC transporter substrate-binding protein [archaeon]|nr:ABC transporter substrate-binding protein [archaeon]